MAANIIPFPVKGRTASAVILQTLQPSTGKHLPLTVDADSVPRINARGKLRVNSQGYAYFTTHREGEQRLARFLIALDGDQLPAGLIVDHINRNPLDNRLANLRLVSSSQNLKNTAFKRMAPESGQTGVYRGPGGKWQVRISIDNHDTSFGLFSDLDEARAVARREIAKREGRIAQLAAAFTQEIRRAA